MFPSNQTCLCTYTPKLNKKVCKDDSSIKIEFSCETVLLCNFPSDIVCVNGTTSFILLMPPPPLLLLSVFFVLVRYVWLPKFQCHRMPKRFIYKYMYKYEEPKSRKADSKISSLMKKKKICVAMWFFSFGFVLFYICDPFFADFDKFCLEKIRSMR